MESIDQSCAPDLRQSILSSSSPTENSSPKKRFFTTQEDFNMTGASLDPNLPNRKKTQAEVIFNVSGTKYPVVRSVGKDIFNWTLSTDSHKEWDVAWIDYISDYSIFSKIKPFQKVSFFPGIKCLARKDQLGLNLMRLKRKFPTAYDFFPETYVLPGDYEEFRAEINKGKQQTVYIVKPQASCQGKGIFLTNTISNIDRGIDYVAQKYLTRPYLIDGLKFDMRIYVFLSSCDPLRIYLYEDGLARFATEPYKSPNLDNLNDVFMHLTNYAINKNSPNFVFNNSSANNDVGHKRSIKSLFKILKEQGHDVTHLWNEIKKIIIKTFCCGQSTLAHTYKSYMSKNSANNCFQIFGIDIMLDEDLKPWLLELNQSPSWTTDTPFDKMIKENVIRDALKILNISAKDRTNYKKKLREEIEARSLHGKPPRPTEEQIKAEFNRKQEELDQWEASNGTGGYEKIYPIKTSSEDMGPDENYAEFLAAGKDTSPFKDISLYRFPLTNPDSMASPQFSPKNGKSPQMVFGGSYKSQQKHFSPLRKRKSDNKANSKQNFYSRGTLPDQNTQKDQEGDVVVEDIVEEKRPTTQKNAKTKNGQGRKSSNGRKNKQAGKKMFNGQKPTLQLGDFDDLLDDNVNPTSTGTSNKSVERKEELVEKSASKNKNCPHPSAFPRQLAASIFERLAAGKKQYAKIALHIPSDPSNAVRMDISNTHKMTLEKKLEEQRSGFIPKRFTQNLSNREMGKNLASTQNLKAENSSVIVETTTEPDVRDIMSPSSTPQNKKFIQGREKHNSDKVTFGRESINRPSQTQFGNFLMPKRFENAYTGSKSRVMFSTSYEKNSWVRGSSADPESPIPLGSFLKAAVNVKNKP